MAQHVDDFLLAQLEQWRAQRAERSLVSSAHTAITDLLPDGVPRKSMIVRRLGTSERPLHRHLAEHGETFQ